MNASTATGLRPELLKEVDEVLEEAAAEPEPRRTKVEDKGLQRLIAESSLYDHPTPRLILNQISALRMEETSRYPKDAPKFYPDGRPWEKEDWCWMGQRELSMRCGLDSDGRTFRWWIDRFRADGTVITRTWTDDYGTKHTEYKVIGEAFMAFQRPEDVDAALAARTPRYKDGSRKGKKKNAGMFSTTNQPKKVDDQPELSAQRRAIMEEDDE
ncbi:MAG TPA: hypothetical protein VNZ03_15470 [Terriglobales bacterium]|jgi:hypothetical protein|nr:hypothetical protein [Terriglobales bacterium]